MSANAKKYLSLGIILSLTAICFAVLHYFNIIKGMDLYLAVTYVSYFVGLALWYNGAYNRAHSRTKSTLLNFSLGTIFILASIGLLVYGVINGLIVLF